MSAPNSEDRNDNQAHIYSRRSSFSPGSALTDLFSGRASQPYPGPNGSLAQRNRRMSLTGGTSPTQLQSNISLRRGSVSSISSSVSNLEENAVDEDNASPTMPNNPFARRMSFGARALRDVRIPGARAGPQPPGSKEIPKSGGHSPPSPTSSFNPHHQRRPSVSTMPLPVSSMPTALPTKQQDDPLQERILKGDFYMD